MWKLTAFNTLTPHQLYGVLQLRAQVFVVEQACLFEDIDGADTRAWHLTGHIDNRLLAYARCFGPGAAFSEASIGRIAIRADQRGTGLGHALVERAVASVGELWGEQPIRIGAQARLKAFYESHRFVDVGRPYIEDGIDHLEMLRKEA